MATRKLQSSKATKSAPVKAAPFMLQEDQLSAFGIEMATAATQAISSAGNYWDRCRTMFVPAQQNGKGKEALDALFNAGDKVKGKKAPWYRTYKSILNSALTLGIAVTDAMGMSELQKAIKARKDEAAENDPAVREEKIANAKKMFRNMAIGCLKLDVPKSELARILKDCEA